MKLILHNSHSDYRIIRQITLSDTLVMDQLITISVCLFVCLFLTFVYEEPDNLSHSVPNLQEE